MEFNIHTFGDVQIAELPEYTIQRADAQDTFDLMSEATYLGADILILHENSFDPGFFDLSTRIAGEVAQKVVNYRFRIMIIGDFEKYQSKSLRDYIRESNLGRNMNFFSSMDEAWKRLRSEAGR